MSNQESFEPQQLPDESSTRKVVQIESNSLRTGEVRGVLRPIEREHQDISNVIDIRTRRVVEPRYADGQNTDTDPTNPFGTMLPRQSFTRKLLEATFEKLAPGGSPIETDNSRGVVGTFNQRNRTKNL